MLDQFDAHQRHMEDLCTRLELIADLLPDQTDPTLCKFTSDNIVKTLSDAQTFEEKELFPILHAPNPLQTNMIDIFDQLREEHYDDLCSAEEVRDNLRAIIKGQPAQSANATGYMLRGFFEKLRRHMAHERNLVSAFKAKKTPGMPGAS